MTDITAISSILTSIKTATDIARLLKESDYSLEKAEAKLKLAELVSSLADAKIEIAQVQDLLLEKDDQIRRLKEQRDIKEKIQWENPYYWLIDGDNKDGPYCQKCYDENKALIRLQGGSKGYWHCASCKNSYRDKSYIPPTAHTRSRGFSI